MLKVLLVFGTRPEAIKLAPVIRELTLRSDHLVSKVCVTAQHREMLDQVLALFGIVPDHDLDLMRQNQTPTQVAATVMAQLEPILQQEQPDWVLVQGDTTTVAAAAWAAFYAGARVGHVEAGLRTQDKWQPFPEEVNRKVATAIADLHFAPTETARRNLLREGVAEESIIVTGNPVIDALHWVVKQPFDTDQWPIAPSMLDPSRKLVLVTAHRRENFGQPLADICGALKDIAGQYKDQVCIVYPVHLNPNVWTPVHQALQDVPNIVLTRPMEYLPLVHLMQRCHMVLTDSGGIQEEAPGLGKPVLVLREKTERPEAVAAGTVQLVGTDRGRIVAQVSRLLEDDGFYQKMSRAINPYGDGHAAERIVGTLLGESVPAFGGGHG